MSKNPNNGSAYWLLNLMISINHRNGTRGYSTKF